MQLFAYRKTEASARFNLAPEPVETTVDNIQLRQQRAARDEAERVRQAALRASIMADQRKEANEAIRRANEALRKFNSTGRSIEQITFSICTVFKISRSELLSNRRNRHVVLARQAIMYWSMRLSKLSSPEIGRRLGGMDHTTVLHGKDAYVEKRKAMGRNLRKVR